MTKKPYFIIILYVCLVLYSLQNALNYEFFQLLTVDTHALQ